MAPPFRKLALTAHIASSVGFMGAVATFLVLAFAGLVSQDAQTVRAAYLAMALTTSSIIVPMSFAALLTGLVESLGTPWGLFRHYWVLAKLVLTLLITMVLLLQTEPIAYVARVASETTLANGDLRNARSSLVIHAGGGLLVLLVITTLSVYKPAGLTRYGWRKQCGHRARLRP